MRATCLRIISFIHSFSTASVEKDCEPQLACARRFGRSFSRKTNFRPDQVSSTAQTFTSTRPAPNPTLRMTSSVRSVLMPEAFFGHEIQSMPSGCSFAAVAENFFARSCLLLTNKRMKSKGCREDAEVKLVPGGRSINLTTSSGAFKKAIRNPGLIPSFLTKGVPE